MSKVRFIGLDVHEFEARWAAWRARGAAHERAVRRRFSLVAPLVAIAVGIIGFLWSR